jgi:hypothetical protein
VKIRTRVCRPIRFARSGHAASRDRSYVRSCYREVVDTMQKQLDELRQAAASPSSFSRFFSFGS